MATPVREWLVANEPFATDVADAVDAEIAALADWLGLEVVRA